MPVADAHILEGIVGSGSAPTIEEKLEALGLSVMPEDGSVVPKADSIQSALVQAVHTKDNNLLETCLGMSNPTIIKNTSTFYDVKVLLTPLSSSVTYSLRIGLFEFGY